jgi:hypothetical protein
VRLSNLDDLRAQSKSKRAAHPEGENELYRRWQVGQYSQTMFTTHYDEIDNDRYPDLKWTSFADLRLRSVPKQTAKETEHSNEHTQYRSQQCSSGGRLMG